MRPTNFTYDVEFSEAVTAGRLISFSPRLNAAAGAHRYGSSLHFVLFKAIFSS